MGSAALRIAVNRFLRTGRRPPGPPDMAKIPRTIPRTTEMLHGLIRLNREFGTRKATPQTQAAHRKALVGTGRPTRKAMLPAATTAIHESARSRRETPVVPRIVRQRLITTAPTAGTLGLLP